MEKEIGSGSRFSSNLLDCSFRIVSHASVPPCVVFSIRLCRMFRLRGVSPSFARSSICESLGPRRETGQTFLFSPLLFPWSRNFQGHTFFFPLKNSARLEVTDRSSNAKGYRYGYVFLDRRGIKR